MFSSRERIIRGFKNTQGKFLQYDLTNQLTLGDVFIWDGWHAKIEQQNSLNTLGIHFDKRESSGVHDHYISSSNVFCFQCNITNCYSLNLARKGCYSMQTFNTKCDSIDRLALVNNISEHIKNKGEWNKRWIVVTDVWKAEYYTRLVSSSWRGAARFILPLIPCTELINIANPVIVSNPYLEQDLTDVILAKGPTIPYVQGAKYRRSGDSFSLIDYASTWRDRLSDLRYEDT